MADYGPEGDTRSWLSKILGSMGDGALANIPFANSALAYGVNGGDVKPLLDHQRAAQTEHPMAYYAGAALPWTLGAGANVIKAIAMAAANGVSHGVDNANANDTLTSENGTVPAVIEGMNSALLQALFSVKAPGLWNIPLEAGKFAVGSAMSAEDKSARGIVEHMFNQTPAMALAALAGQVPYSERQQQAASLRRVGGGKVSEKANPALMKMVLDPASEFRRISGMNSAEKRYKTFLAKLGDVNTETLAQIDTLPDHPKEGQMMVKDIFEPIKKDLTTGKRTGKSKNKTSEDAYPDQISALNRFANGLKESSLRDYVENSPMTKPIEPYQDLFNSYEYANKKELAPYQDLFDTHGLTPKTLPAKISPNRPENENPAFSEAVGMARSPIIDLIDRTFGTTLKKLRGEQGGYIDAVDLMSAKGLGGGNAAQNEQAKANVLNGTPFSLNTGGGGTNMVRNITEGITDSSVGQGFWNALVSKAIKPIPNMVETARYNAGRAKDQDPGNMGQIMRGLGGLASTISNTNLLTGHNNMTSDFFNGDEQPLISDISLSTPSSGDVLDEFISQGKSKEDYINYMMSRSQ